MSYGTNAEMLVYWSERGFEPGISESEMTRVRKAGSIFVDGLGWRRVGHRPVSRFPGRPTLPGQEREWPRVGAADIYGAQIPANQVPGAVERAAYEAAYHEASNRGALNSVVRTDQMVVREKFGDVSFEYAQPAGGAEAAAPIIPAVMTILNPVLTGGRNPYGITGVVA